MPVQNLSISLQCVTEINTYFHLTSYNLIQVPKIEDFLKLLVTESLEFICCNHVPRQVLCTKTEKITNSSFLSFLFHNI